MLILVTGGSAGGKSKIAEDWICGLYRQDCPDRTKKEGLYYIATMEAVSETARQRIKRHRAMRQGKGFSTIECPAGLAEYVKQRKEQFSGSFVLLECTGNMTANEMFGGYEPGEGTAGEYGGEDAGGEDEENMSADTVYTERVLSGIRLLKKLCRYVVVVHNEIGMEGESVYGSVETYRKVMGEVGRALEKESAASVFCAAGRTIVLKGEEDVIRHAKGIYTKDGKTAMTKQLAKKSGIKNIYVGGRWSGKGEFARRNEPETVWEDGGILPLSRIGEAKAIEHMDRLIIRLIDEKPDLDAGGICRILTDRENLLSFTCSEVGCGVVPADPVEIKNREMIGRVCGKLMEQAQAGWYIVCGRGIPLK